MIAVRPLSGLANRLRVISSFRVLAEMANRDFFVCWAPSPGFSDERLEDLFEHDLRLITEEQFEVLTTRGLRLHEAVTITGFGNERTWTWAEGTDFNQIFDPAVPAVTYAGMQSCEGLLDPDDRRRALDDSFAARYVEDVRTWRPVRKIRRAVDRIAARYGPNTIGVHVRRGDAVADPNPRSPWRRSPDAAFFDAMDHELDVDAGATFFLATDSAETEQLFRERYGDAILTNPKKVFVPSERQQPKENQRDAVIDLFALARTNRVLGSYYSSFSKMAAVLGAIPRVDVVEREELPVLERVRRRSRLRPQDDDGRDTVASFAVNNIGLGHTSRLIAVHDELRSIGGLGSTFFVEDHRQMIEDYRFEQVALPHFRGTYMGSVSVPSRERDLARSITELALAGRRPIVLHDVFVHRSLYEVADELDWPQALIYRPRRDVKDPVAWLRKTAPAVSTIFAIGSEGLVREEAGIAMYGVDDVVRRPLGDAPLWTEPFADLRIMVTAGGGGRPDAAPFLAAAVEAVDAVARRCGCSVDVRIVTGPFYGGEIHIPGGSPASYTVTRYLPPTFSFYWGSSVVVAQSGYNTFSELGRSGIPHVLVPGGEFGVDDQRGRAEQRGGDHVQVVESDAVAIAKAIEHVVAMPAPEWDPPPRPSGAADIANALALIARVDS